MSNRIRIVGADYILLTFQFSVTLNKLFGERMLEQVYCINQLISQRVSQSINQSINQSIRMSTHVTPLQ